MKLTTLGAADALGAPIPVFIPDTYRTRIIQTTAGVVTTLPFDSSEEARPYIYIQASNPENPDQKTDLYLYAMGNVYEANHIQLHINLDQGSEDCNIIRKEIDLILTINTTGSSIDIEDIVDRINEFNAKLGKNIITYSYDTSKYFYETGTPVHEYFRRYRPGRCANLVRVLTFDDDVFIGNFPESGDPWNTPSLITPAASMPLVPGVETYIMLSPNEMLSVSGGGTAGKKVYITPQRNY
jgi:hypothetical protein